MAEELDEAEDRQILTEFLPLWTRGAVEQERPVLVVVAGPPGARKTTVADLVEAAGPCGCAATSTSTPTAPTARSSADIRTAGVKMRPDTSRWQAGAEEYVRASQFDVVTKSALADAGEFRLSPTAYRRSGHHIEILVVATAETWSQLGTLGRPLDSAAADEDARCMDWNNLGTCTEGLPVTLAVVEAERLADRITMVRRDGPVFYGNELVDGVWRHRVAADRAVAYELRRPWNAPETAVFHPALARRGAGAP
ncbi:MULTISPECIES: zeta toxin family protein [unclassified Streptomyces]|uniref:zeta toxin family protein n=1 Tax=unclassified Streptomyces TaxID=2593676 RepID=UPI0033BDD782